MVTCGSCGVSFSMGAGVHWCNAPVSRSTPAVWLTIQVPYIRLPDDDGLAGVPAMVR